MLGLRKVKFLIASLAVIYSCFFLCTLKSYAADNKELIKKIMYLTGNEKSYQDTITVLSNNLKQVYLAKVQQKVSEEKIPITKTQNLSETTQKAGENMVEKLKQYIQKEIPLDKIIEEVYFPIYDKYFSTEELADIVKFYETPAGKKMVELGPKILQESSPQFNTLYQAKIIDYMDSLVNEEFEKIKPEIEKLREE
jgi:hypothetical protein